MKQLVRYTPISKPIGAISADVPLSDQRVQVGDHVEITDPEFNPLNIAKVIDIGMKDGMPVMTIKMIA